MELVSLVWFVVIIALIILVAKIIVNSFKFIFLLLVAALVAIFWFGISYTEIVDIMLRMLLWVV